MATKTCPLCGNQVTPSWCASCLDHFETGHKPECRRFVSKELHVQHMKEYAARVREKYGPDQLLDGEI